MKKKRLRIHKMTLRSLNNPSYVYLLINPDKKVLAIQRCDNKKRDAIKIDYSQEKDCEIYSLGLLEQMALLDKKTYCLKTHRLFGRIINDKIVEFDIV